MHQMSFLMKKKHLLKTLTLTFLTFMMMSSLGFAQDDSLTQLNRLYQSVLNDYLSPGQKNGLPANMVDYAVIRKDDRLNQLMTLIQDYPQEQLNSPKKEIAFYLNAYNIMSIVKVADNWPLKRLTSLGTFMKPVWTHPAGKVCGQKMTLRILERDILRKLDEPRIHFALNCASMSCPNLRPEPYEADKLEQQLEDQLVKFMQQDGKGRLIIKDGQVKLSAIFEWFDEDFNAEGGVEHYIQAYLPATDKRWEIVGYLNYDWDVTTHLSGSEKRQLKRQRRDPIFRY
jgi:hypothetical protein